MSDHYFIYAETEFRRDRAEGRVAANRAGRGRASWLRRVAAGDPAIERRNR